MARTAKIEEIKDAIKGSKNLREALASVITSGFAPIEVNLFRAMLAYFDAKSYCEVSEVHQHYVEYFNSALNKQKKCEIADLMVVSYSRRNRAMRLNFIQAKRKPKDQPVDVKDSKLKFIIDVPQYQLLLNRPLITSNDPRLPQDILSGIQCCALTAYGVFYWEKGDGVNFAYEVTPLLCPDKKHEVERTSSSSFITSDTIICGHCNLIPFPCLTGPDNCDTLLTTMDANAFVDSLCAFQVGAPLDKRFMSLISQFVLNIHHGYSSPVHSDFRAFVESNREMWNQNTEIDVDILRNNNHQGEDEKDENSMAWVQPHYIMLINSDWTERM